MAGKAMKYVIHKNVWWWGKSYTIITTDGKGMIMLGIDNDNPDMGCIYSLIVLESKRRKGVGTMLLNTAVDMARSLGLNQVYLEANKESFVVNWYLRKGFRIYNDNPENGKGHTVAMNKYL